MSPSIGADTMDRRRQLQRNQITGASMDEPADCTIACVEGHITAHKLVLCDHSRYLLDILSKYPTAEHPIIILTDLNIIDIKILVNYMYTGELVITNDASPTSLLRAAQILKIDSLTADDRDTDEEPMMEDENVDQHVDDEISANNNNSNCTSNINSNNNNTSTSNNNNNIINIANNISSNNSTNSSSSSSNSSNHNRSNISMDHDEPNIITTTANNIPESKSVFNQLADIYNRRAHDLGDDDDEDDDLTMDGDDLDYHVNNNNMNNDTQRLINSIKNIYSLDQPLSLGPSTPGSSGSGSHNSSQQQQHFVKMEFGSNRKDNNSIIGSNLSTPDGLSQHMQQLANNQNIDLQDFQDPKLQLDNKNNKIRCHLCNIGLSDVKCLYRHVLTRHLPEKWGYKCEFCDREFSRDDHLMRHYTTKHKNQEFNREKIRETRRLNREMAKNFHDQISTV